MTAPATLGIRIAEHADAREIAGLVQEAIDWLSELGTDQWQHPKFRNPDRIAASIAGGTTWVVTDNDRAIATVVLDEQPDPEFWTHADDPASALYLHRMVVARSERGMELGSAILDWAGRKALQRGKSRIRLDAWSNNKELHAYYAAHGFRPVRIMSYKHRGSGALFERDAGMQIGRGPALVEV